MALSDIRTRVANNIDRDDIPDTAAGLIDRWINDAQRRVCRAHNFTFMESEADTTLVVDQRNYSLPTGSASALRFKSEISMEIILTNSHRQKLKRIFKQDAEKREEFTDTTGSGTPRSYAIQKGQIYLYPKPNKALTMNIEYYGFLATLSTDAGTNDLMDDYPEVVEALATAFGFRYVYEEERADFWENKAMALVQEMIKENDQNVYGNIEEGIEPESGASTYPRDKFLSDYLVGYF
jgi:hypothetical protein